MFQITFIPVCTERGRGTYVTSKLVFDYTPPPFSFLTAAAAVYVRAPILQAPVLMNE